MAASDPTFPAQPDRSLLVVIGVRRTRRGDASAREDAQSTARCPALGCSLEAAMHMIKAIVRPDKVDDVKDALTKVHVSGMTVSEVRGHGKQKGHTAVYRGKEYQVTLLPKMQIETVVADDLVDAAVEAIIGAARTGEIGDGRVFVTPISRSYKIRTGEVE
jgi:nitrogen regulatory protein P-II 1